MPRSDKGKPRAQNPYSPTQLGLTPGSEAVANALENIRMRLNIVPSLAYGPEGDEDLQTIFQAIDRFSELYSDDDCNDACQWILNIHGMTDW